MYKVDSDKTKNRLYITLGELSNDDIKPIRKDLTEHISKLGQGFTCVVDIRQMHIVPDLMGEEYVAIVQGALADSGMGKVARVINRDNEAAFHRMERSSKKLGYTAILAYSLKEADKILDSQR